MKGGESPDLGGEGTLEGITVYGTCCYSPDFLFLDLTCDVIVMMMMVVMKMIMASIYTVF